MQGLSFQGDKNLECPLDLNTYLCQATILPKPFEVLFVGSSFSPLRFYHPPAIDITSISGSFLPHLHVNFISSNIHNYIDQLVCFLQFCASICTFVRNLGLKIILEKSQILTYTWISFRPLKWAQCFKQAFLQSVLLE